MPASRRLFGFIFILLLEFSLSLDLSAMPRSICGWPSLHTTGLFPPYTVSIAQRMLGIALKLTDFVVDGVFTDDTTNQIIAFQNQAGLDPNGYLNANTWPSLVATVTPLHAGETGIIVDGLQELLTVNGIDTPITSVYDITTVDHVRMFQKRVHAPVTNGMTVDAETWHLLITQCNSTSNNYYWFDAGWPQGNMSTETFSCLHQAGFEFAVIQCLREKDNGSWWPACVDNVANAHAAGFEIVDVYMYPERFAEPTEQADRLLTNLKANNVQYRAVMLDIEGDDWNSFSHESNQEYILSIRSIFESANVPITIYCGKNWIQYFGNEFTKFSDVPLIYAHYDNIPSFYDYDYAPFGGWTSAAGKQFYDGIEPEIVCGISLDWDWSPNKFWN